MKNDLSKVKVGDFVGIISGYDDKILEVTSVVKLTPQQIVTQPGWRYYRSGGKCANSNARGRYIVALTAKQVSDFRKRQQQKQAAREQLEAERQAHQASPAYKHASSIMGRVEHYREEVEALPLWQLRLAADLLSGPISKEQWWELAERVEKELS